MLLDRNVEIKTAEVIAVQHENHLARRLVLADGESVDFDHLTVAAGAWSKALCAEVGDYVPLDSERGYATTIPDSHTSIRILLLFPDDEFVATPMSEGLRLGGTVELAGLDVPPNYRRTDLLVKTIVDYFPDIDTAVRDEWMGHRPSTPDGLPVISKSPSSNNVCYAFGHGHVGVTQSAITGILLAQIVTGERPDVDIEPFSIQRFS